MRLKPLSMSLELPRRRNGRPQACEPCRKRKIACDHALPVCHRCKRRKTTSACIYLAAPMTQKPEVDHELPSISSLPALDIISPRLRRLDIPSKSAADEVTAPTVLTNSSVFFGPTSFSAVFHENQEDLGSALHPGVDIVVTDNALQHKIGTENNALDTHLIRLGTKVLSHLPDQQTCNLLLQRHLHTNENDGWFKPATQYVSDSLWSTFGRYFTSSNGITDIETVARILCKNARTNLQEPDDTRSWLNSFSGHNLRWEALGLLLKSCCHGAMASPETETFTTQGDRQRENKHFVREMQECVSICVTLCSHMDFVNPVMVALFYNNALLLSVLGAGGDTSFLLWRHHADLVSATTALGLHREPDSRHNKPNIKSEVRRRIFASVFSIDKTLASFTGRPPFLSHRYSSRSMLLDVNDDVWLMDEEERAKIISEITPDGWSPDGQVTTVTNLRVNTYLALIRDEILEISLGSWNECLPNCIYSLKARSEKEYLEFPGDIKYQQGDLLDPKISDRKLTSRLSCHLKYLQNLFLLERLAIKHGEADGQALLDIAREMLSLNLLLYTNRDRFLGRHHNFEWLIVCYGVPASGVLSFELLKQSKNPQAPRLNLPRSETIQNLSLFIGFLNWVRSNAANYEVCCKMKEIISRVLDQILEGPSQTQLNPTFDVDMPVDMFDFDAFGDFDFLGETDWMKAPWLGTT